MTINIVRGDDIDMDFTAKEKDGSVINLNNVDEIIFEMRAMYGTTVEVTKTLADDVIKSDAENGILTVTLSNANTEALTKGIYLYRVVLIDTGGRVSTIKKKDQSFAKINVTEFIPPSD